MDIISSGLQFKGTMSKRKNTTSIILHHAAASIADVETIHRWHLGRGWAGIGYHFYVRKDGSAYQGRGWDYVGAHCEGHNSASIGICFEGNFETEIMSESQYETGVALIQLAILKFPSITEICGHKSHGATACPGINFPIKDMISASWENRGNVSTETNAPAATTGTVKSLQKALNEDGICDAAGRKLAEDGIKGPNTSAAIKKILLKSGLLSGNKYKVGSNGELVKWLQERLNLLNGCNLTVDGKFGTDTRAAVGRWQEINHLTVDYMAGVDTITSLL